MLLQEIISKRIIKERATTVLYHYTKIENAVNILKTKQFRLSSSLPQDQESSLVSKKHEGKQFYLSTARTPQSAFIRGRSKENNAVIFDLDGDWFNRNNYTVKPVDYFSGTEADKKEHEDRVISNDPIIKLNNNLVKSIHLYIGNIEYSPKLILQFISDSKKYGIQLFAYYDFKAFILQNTKKSVELRQVINDLKEYTPYQQSDPDAEITPKNKIIDDKNARLKLKAVYELVKAKKPEDLSDTSVQILEDAILQNPTNDLRILFNSIMIAPNSEYGKRLLQLVKATKIPMKDIFNKLADKWMGLSYMIDTKSISKKKSPIMKRIPSEDNWF
jgi:hypothetical protein